MKTRKAILSGTWYPDAPAACETQIRDFLAQGLCEPASDNRRVGGIVPHAGWYFSGAIACGVIHCLQDGTAPNTIVVFGMHMGPGQPNIIMAEGAWETPFGPIAIDADFAADLTARFPFAVETAERHSRDNTIEVQLPFIKYFFPNTAIVPIGVPPDGASLAIGRAVAEIARSRNLKVKVLGSTDLTHYGPNYGFQPQGPGRAAVDWVRFENDRRVIEAMLAMDAQAVIRESLDQHNACCGGAAATAIEAGRALGSDGAESIAYATSYEKHPGDSFVGYVGILF